MFPLIILIDLSILENCQLVFCRTGGSLLGVTHHDIVKDIRISFYDEDSIDLTTISSDLIFFINFIFIIVFFQRSLNGDYSTSRYRIFTYILFYTNYLQLS
jgi:hypothetical protein